MRLPFTTLVVFIIIFFNSASTVFSQGNDTESTLKGKGTVFIEFFGNGGWYSLNYDRVFYHKRRDALTWRAGFAYWPYSNDYNKSSEMSFLGEFNYLRGKKRHFLELGIGLTYWRVFRVDQRVDQSAYVNFYFEPRIGYRYQKAEGGSFFRIGVLPVVDLDRNLDQRLWLNGGVSLGYSFKFFGRKSGKKENSDCPKP